MCLTDQITLATKKSIKKPPTTKRAIVAVEKSKRRRKVLATSGNTLRVAKSRTGEDALAILKKRSQCLKTVRHSLAIEIICTAHTTGSSLRLTEQQDALKATVPDAEAIASLAPSQAVRGTFTQGDAISITSATHGQSHIRIALRDMKCVLGWFLVPGDVLLSTDQYITARTTFEAPKSSKTAVKKRVRLSLHK